MQSIINELQGRANTAYCRYIDLMSSKICLGQEYKLKHGQFGQEELDAIKEASIELGKHRAYCDVIDLLNRR